MNAATMFQLKWGEVIKAKSPETQNAARAFLSDYNQQNAALNALDPDMRALAMKIDAVELELKGTRIAADRAEVQHRLAGLNVAFSRLALAADIAAQECAEAQLEAARLQAVADDEARAEAERQRQRDAAAEVERQRVEGEAERQRNERREQRSPLLTRRRSLDAEHEEATAELANSRETVAKMQRKGFDETYPEFAAAQRDVTRLTGYVERINADLAEVRAALDALPEIE